MEITGRDIRMSLGEERENDIVIVIYSGGGGGTSIKRLEKFSGEISEEIKHC